MLSKPLTYTEIIKTNEGTLIKEFREYTNFCVISDLDEKEQRDKAAKILSECAGYMSYFREMCMIARVQKREARAAGAKDEVRHLLDIEDILDTYYKICEQHYDYITKLMTLKRLGLDEAKILGGQI